MFLPIRFFFLFLLFSNISFAKLKVVCDIDDTIKISHVLDFKDAITNAFKTDKDNAFKGMSTLLRGIKESNPTTEFFYVSNAPALLLSGRHRSFLVQNDFPGGQLHLNPKMGGDHKLVTISKIIESHAGNQFIFLGDNGENDTLTYDLLARKYSNTAILHPSRFVQMIRINYTKSAGGKGLLQDQIGFVSSAEVAISLYEIGLLRWEETSQVLAEMSYQSCPETAHNRPADILCLPLWVDCDGHHIMPGLRAIQSQNLQQIVHAIDLRCK